MRTPDVKHNQRIAVAVFGLTSSTPHGRLSICSVFAMTAGLFDGIRVFYKEAEWAMSSWIDSFVKSCRRTTPRACPGSTLWSIFRKKTWGENGENIGHFDAI
jgi:hypothetical protein